MPIAANVHQLEDKYEGECIKQPDGYIARNSKQTKELGYTGASASLLSQQ